MCIYILNSTDGCGVLVKTGFINYDFSIIKLQNAITLYNFYKKPDDYFASKQAL